MNGNPKPPLSAHYSTSEAYQASRVAWAEGLEAQQPIEPGEEQEMYDGARLRRAEQLFSEAARAVSEEIAAPVASQAHEGEEAAPSETPAPIVAPERSQASAHEGTVVLTEAEYQALVAAVEERDRATLRVLELSERLQALALEHQRTLDERGRTVRIIAALELRLATAKARLAIMMTAAREADEALAGERS